MARKLKRKIRSLDAANFEKIYHPKVDQYLKERATPSSYEKIMKLLRRRTRELNISLQEGFGIRPTISLPSITQSLAADPNFSMVVDCLSKTGLSDLLNTSTANSGYTMFAPTNDAFGKLPSATVEGLVADLPKLTSILKHHVAENYTTSHRITGSSEPGRQVAPLTSIVTLEGTKLTLKSQRTPEFLITIENSAKVIIRDMKCGNGVIHVIDTVLIPPTKK